MKASTVTSPQNMLKCLGVVFLLFVILPHRKNNDAIANNKTNDPLRQLWKGGATLVGTNSTTSLFDAIHIVISHCNEDLDWFNDFSKEVVSIISSITVITKCGATGDDIKGLPPQSNIITLPNVGREGHSYAHYLSHILPSLLTLKNDRTIVLFLKGNRHIHQLGRTRPLTEILSIAAERGFACWLELKQWRPWYRYLLPRDMSCAHDTTILKQFSNTFYKNKKRDDMDSFKSIYDNLGDWWDNGVQGPSFPEPYTPVCYAGVFAATVEAIAGVEVEFWSRVEESLSRADNLQEGHFMERSWAGLLSRSYSRVEVETLREYASSVLKRKNSYYGTLVKDSWIWS